MTITIHGPRDVPALRDELLRGWVDDGVFAMTAEAMRGGREYFGGEFPEKTWQRFALNHATLWWVTDEMCELLLAAEQSLPDDTILESMLMPREHGLVVFERSLSGIDSETATSTIKVDAMLWAPIVLAAPPPGADRERWQDVSMEVPAVGIASYCRMNPDLGLSKEELELAVNSGAINQAELYDHRRDGDALTMNIRGEIWGPLGRADWPIGSEVTQIESAYEPEAVPSITEDRRRMAALWILLAQEGIVRETEVAPSRGERRRAERAGLTVPNVRVIDVARARGGGSHHEAEYHQHVRYIVSGHWRRQVYGPGRAYRRPTWIAPHWRGPDDAPISNVEKVRVLRKHEDAPS